MYHVGNCERSALVLVFHIYVSIFTDGCELEGAVSLSDVLFWKEAMA